MALPPHLAERVAPGAPPPRPGRFIVYWTRIAARATENPALDVAVWMARELDLPVFVYHAVSERYPYASDRLHTFILEGARDLHADLAARGIGSVFHLERRGDRRPHLARLARDAALVVTDFMPVSPLREWDRLAATHAPLWRVDASCIAPVWALDTPVDRAYLFRKAASPLWKARVTRRWVDVEPHRPPFRPELPGVELASADLPALVASCDIDHGISPVRHTPGGSVAGNARWTRFAAGTLARYHRDRNDPLREASSRISAYLHFGHLSPFRVAREAAEHGSEGADKFLDELLTWRELAWHFCLHHEQHGSVQALPAWARQSLDAHRTDPREFLPSYEQLARAQTGDPLWDACQRSLLVHGELHNNVRMTWGKALVPWTRTAAEALALLLDLNHRYALDGRDPSSYGGILWCLGAMDRPFPPARPALGVVRPRPLAEHSRRLDVAAYARRVSVPSTGTSMEVGIIGAGVAGAAAARVLTDSGHRVVIHEKSRGPGGRMSTRREGALSFDHGAPFFTVRDERFARFARAWWQEGVLARWTPRAAKADQSPAWVVGTPGMSAVVKRMVHGLEVRSGTRVERLERRGERIAALGERGAELGVYDAVVVAVPAPQAAALVEPVDGALARRAAAVRFVPTWAVMLAFPGALPVEVDAMAGTGPLSWIAREASRPGRGPAERWVLHASGQWARDHEEAEPPEVLGELVPRFFDQLEVSSVEPVFRAAHRWRYAVAEAPLGEDCLVAGRVVVCGDWCLGKDVESAYLSGVAAGGRLNALAPATG